MVESAAARVESWFRLAESCGLILPDGWFGRPSDNRHVLTFVAERPHMLIVELDDQLMLTFTEIESLEVEDSRLILGSFATCVFDWQEYGKGKSSHVSVHQDGAVALVPPDGTIIKDGKLMKR